MADAATGVAVFRFVVPPPLKANHPNVPWRQIADIGNIFRHAYDHVNDQRVWSTVTEDLAPLKRAIETMTASIDDEG